MRQQRRSQSFGLIMTFNLIVFLSLLINSAISSGFIYLLMKLEVIVIPEEAVPHMGRLILFSALFSVPVSFFITIIAGKAPLKPLRELIDGMSRLASGDFKARISTENRVFRFTAFQEVADSFNKMAEELESTEMLRSDFINNFSHEFKTPIVSIAGFAKLLKRGDLSPEQQKEYLSVVEEESMRLSNMATNVLNLTKVENQTILTDVTEYNLSEQIRSCILLLEDKWEKKELELQLDFGEHQIRADKELLKQVWINLLGNAVKFAPEGHTVGVKITETEERMIVEVRNTGSEISPEQQKKVFRKFYQADESHAAEGNGVGLAIVKRIVQLHGGEVRVSSGNNRTTFSVLLPKTNLNY